MCPARTPCKLRLPSRRTLVAACLLGWAAAGICRAGESDGSSSPLQAIRDGSLLLNLRPRYESVDQAGKPDSADAFTLRTLAGWKTGTWRDLAATFELINVAHLVDDFNDSPAAAAASRYPLVADPEETDLNQFYLDYTALPATAIRVGRQSIKLDNTRFVGNVEFRQVMQVFDAVAITNHSLPGVELYYAHVFGLRNIFGDHRDSRTELLHAAWQWRADNQLVAYGYLQDQPNTGSATGFTDNSSRILGIRADGAWPLAPDWRLLYTVEYARQNPYAGGDGRIDAHYLHAGGGATYRQAWLRADYELLSSHDGVYAFQTPLGTNHLFQGWADQFLTTPRQGIRDVFLDGGVKFGKAQLTGEYHWLNSDEGSIDFGTELDLGLSYGVLKNLAAKLEYARYREGDVLAGAARKRDATKLWATLIYTY